MIAKVRHEGIYLEAHMETDWDGDIYIKHLYADPKQDILPIVSDREAEEIEHFAIQYIKNK